jgi:hypothetical protein
MEGRELTLDTLPKDIIHQVANCYRTWIFLRLTCRQFGFLGDYHAFHGLEFIHGDGTLLSRAEFVDIMINIITYIAPKGIRVAIRLTSSAAPILTVSRRGDDAIDYLFMTFYEPDGSVLFSIYGNNEVNYISAGAEPIYVYNEAYGFMTGSYGRFRSYKYIYDNYPELFLNIRMFAMVARRRNPQPIGW